MRLYAIPHTNKMFLCNLLFLLAKNDSWTVSVHSKVCLNDNIVVNQIEMNKLVISFNDIYLIAS